MRRWLTRIWYLEAVHLKSSNFLIFQFREIRQIVLFITKSSFIWLEVSMKNINGINSVLDIHFKLNNGKKYHRWMPLNPINPVFSSIHQYIALVFLNKRKLTSKNIQLRKLFGKKFLSIISFRIRLTLLLDLPHVKSIKEKYSCLGVKSS